MSPEFENDPTSGDSQADNPYQSIDDLLAFRRTHYGFSLRNPGMLPEHYDEAERLYRDSLTIFQRLGDVRGAATIQNSLADLLRLRRQYEEAELLYRRSLANFHQLGDLQGVATTQNSLADLLMLRGYYEEAMKLYRDSLGTFRQQGDIRGEALTQSSLADLLSVLGAYEEAERLYSESLEVFERLGDRRYTAMVQQSRADLATQLKEFSKAQWLYEESLAISRQLGDIRGQALTQNSLANLLRLWGKYDQAEQLYRESLEMLEDIGDGAAAARVRRSLDTIEGIIADEVDVLRIILPIRSRTDIDEFLEVQRSILQPLDTIYQALAEISSGNVTKALILLEDASYRSQWRTTNNLMNVDGVSRSEPRPVVSERVAFYMVDEALGIRDAERRAHALLTLAQILPPATQYSVLREVLSSARAIEDERLRARILFAMASKMPEDVLDQALGLQDSRLRTSVLVKLAPHIPGKVLAAVETKYIRRESERVAILDALAPQLPPKVIFGAAQRINDEELRARLLGRLVPYLDQEDRDHALELLGEVRLPLTRDYLSRLRVASFHYASPALTDLLGLAGLIEQIRELIKDLGWRGKHEMEMAKEELEEKRLANLRLRTEIVDNLIETSKKLKGGEFDQSEQAALAELLGPQVQLLIDAPVRPQLAELGSGGRSSGPPAATA